MTTSGVASLLSSAVRCGLIPGGVAAWGSSAQQLRSAAAGTTGYRSGTGRTPQLDTIYDLASLTKPLVVGTLTVLAQREGLISIDAPVGEYLPEAAGTDWESTSLEHLLTHTAGLPAWLPLYAVAEGMPEQAVRCLLDIRRSPGSDAERSPVYSCLGFILMGWILERVFGESLDREFRRRVTAPLGLENEVLFLPASDGADRFAEGAVAPEAERRLVTELDMDPRRIPRCGPGLPDDGNCRFLGGVAGNAGLFGSARGVYRLALELLPQSTRLFSTAELELLSVCRTQAGGLRRSLGWQLGASLHSSAGPALSGHAIGHTGFTGTSLWIDAGRGMVMVLLTNRVHPVHRSTDLHPLRRRFHVLAVGEA